MRRKNALLSEENNRIEQQLRRQIEGPQSAWRWGRFLPLTCLVLFLSLVCVRSCCLIARACVLGRFSAAGTDAVLVGTLKELVDRISARSDLERQLLELKRTVRLRTRCGD